MLRRRSPKRKPSNDRKEHNIWGTVKLSYLMIFVPGDLVYSPDSWQAIEVLTFQRWGLRWRTFEPTCCPDCGGEVILLFLTHVYLCLSVHPNTTCRENCKATTRKKPRRADFWKTNAFFRHELLRRNSTSCKFMLRGCLLRPIWRKSTAGQIPAQNHLNHHEIQTQYHFGSQ